MLRQRLRRLLAFMAAGVLAGAVLLAVGAPAHADGTWCDANNVCYQLASSPGVDPAPNPDPETGFTPGASNCTYTQLWGVHATVTVPCSTSSANYWSNYRQCYVGLADVQGAAPGYATNPEGAWYWCDDTVPTNLSCDPGDPLGCRPLYTASFWSDYPPPGVFVLTPRQAALQLIKTFQLQGVQIGMAPQVNPQWSYRRTYVGVPVWLWVDNPQPLTWGPYSQTATIGGQTITATAQVSSVIWDMGDGGTTVCGNLGTAYTVGYGVTSSPTCGYRYQTTSKHNAGDRFTVTATSQWNVDWTAATGENGVINLTTTSTDALQVAELQTVIVPNPSN